MALTSASWKGQEKANFVLRMDGVYNPRLFMESALK